jgi:hypothetical protein
MSKINTAYQPFILILNSSNISLINFFFTLHLIWSSQYLDFLVPPRCEPLYRILKKSSDISLVKQLLRYGPYNFHFNYFLHSLRNIMPHNTFSFPSVNKVLWKIFCSFSSCSSWWFVLTFKFIACYFKFHYFSWFDFIHLFLFMWFAILNCFSKRFFMFHI